MKQTEDQQPQVCSEFCFSGSEALGFMSVRIWRKSCSLEGKSAERKRERCKGMCGALRVWMIGEMNQVPSWPSCQSLRSPSQSFTVQVCERLFIYFFSFLETGPRVRCCFGVCVAGEFPSVHVCFSKLLQLCTGTCLDGDE